MLCREITQKVIDAAHAVHTTLLHGFKRDIYLRAMKVELGARGIPFTADVEHPVFYRSEAVGSTHIELIVENKVLVHVRDEADVRPDAYAEVRCLLQAHDIPVGLVLSFGTGRVDVRRVEASMRNHKGAPSEPIQ